MSDCCKSSNGDKLYHNVPQIEPISLKGKNRVLEALLMKEVKLPYAEQTHEVCWEPHTQSLFVTQLSNSTLVRLTVDEKGMLRDEMEAWSIGPENGALHNASVSYSHKGHIWLSLQALNTLLLVDVNPGDDFLKVKEIYQVPTFIMVDGKKQHVGTPHCMRESPTTGNIWACLKGALDEDHPCAKVSPCCDPVKLKAAMDEHEKNPEFDIHFPDGFAVWQLDRSKYNPKCPLGAKGGKIHDCLKSPVMSTLDNNNNMWVAQDKSPTVLFVNGSTGETEQIAVPWPIGTNEAKKHTGAGIATAPDGSVWMAQLEATGSMVRIDPATKKCVLYELEAPSWAQSLRMIHMDFNKASIGAHHNRIYAICSSLLNDESSDALIIMNMCRGWKDVLGIRIVPLPSQLSACHRICYCDIEDNDDDCDDGSVFITEMTKAKLLQVKVNHDVRMNLIEHEQYENEGFECHKYKLTDTIES